MSTDAATLVAGQHSTNGFTPEQLDLRDRARRFVDERADRTTYRRRHR